MRRRSTAGAESPRRAAYGLMGHLIAESDPAFDGLFGLAVDHGLRQAASAGPE